jgi:exopolysaccharide biosynthesis polyprenyl glycosylphosphotransferase
MTSGTLLAPTSAPPWHRRGPAGLARCALLPVSDGIALTAGTLLAATMVPAPVAPAAAGYVLCVLLVLGVRGRHRLRICLRVSDELPGLVGASALSALPLPLIPASPLTAGGLTLFAGACAGLLVLVRAGLYALLRAAHRRGRLVESGLVVGTGTLGVEVAELLRAHPEFGLRPAGFVDSLPPGEKCTLPLLGPLVDLPELIARHRVSRVIVCFPADSDADVVTVLRAARPLPADVCVVPRLYELAASTPEGCRDEVWGVPLIPLRRFGFGRIAHTGRRAFDLLVGSVLLVAGAPLLLALALLVLIRDGAPVLFRQERLSEGDRVVRVVKLRTVRPGVRPAWLVSPQDCSRLGRWLRGTHLDELPQVLNVLSGEMSLVGPRPERPHFAERFAEVVPRYADRRRVRGGMTGWAQVHGLYGDTPIADRTRFDNHYVEHWSLWLDVVILARTLAAPLTGARRERRARGEAS